MSLISRSNMGTPSFREFKKQASFFLKEKIKTARLALTDVTPAQLLTEEATNGNPQVPDARTLRSISRAAFEVDDFWRIVEILHNRLSSFEKKNWRFSYNSLIVLEHLLTHGPESVAEEFQCHKDVISEIESFQFIDEKGFNWGLAVRKKSERILKLLEKGPLLKEERDRARKITREIQGFGSFSQRSSSTQGILQESRHGTYGRSHSDFNRDECKENQVMPSNEDDPIVKSEKSQQGHGVATMESIKETKVLNQSGGLDDTQMLGNPRTQTSYKENMACEREVMHKWDSTDESNSILGDKKDEGQVSIEEDHPFNDTETYATASLLSASD
ncbi:ENTH/VHS family protein [Tripterygium wilfordii]|uniref:ENTH/VHS family protein n=1 Tax=Tripterygium wilfordii TaxID=458696 RepID=A0A7J7DYX8_TRIWF|nr:clathrin interactor EPSIN 1 [Tripterygium wilfordii]KAF5751461.1 ENTH/VHS family protein [Tripterygium wilfordii]